MAESTRDRGKPRSSIAWKYFEVQDKNRGIATCNLCHEKFSYRTSVSNLMKHLRGKHYATDYCSSKDDDGGAETDIEQKLDMKPQIKPEVYQYYEIKEDKDLATCSICLEEIIFTSEAELIEHLNGKHNIEVKDDNKDYKSDDEGTDGEKMTLQQLSEAKSGRNKSAAWDYFEVKDEERKVASCNLCGALCSYKSSVSNLMKHAKRKHDIGALRSDEEEEERGDGDGEVKHTSMSRAQRSIVWLYFKCVDPESKLSECLLCKKLLSHSTTLTNLKKHLARKHPNVNIPVREDGRKRILLSSGGELYEVETTSKLDDDEVDEFIGNQDTIEMDTVYLDDFDAIEEQAPKKRRLTKTASKNVTTKDYSSSSEEEVTFVNRYVKKQSDSFDHFAKYIASLLRELPKETSSRLQTDFVKQIMEAKDNNDF